MLLFFQSSGLCVQSPSIISVPGYPLCLVSHLSSSREKALFTLHVMTEMHFLRQKNLKNIMHGRVKMYVMR